VKQSLEKIEFEIIKDIKWDNWGQLVVAFDKGSVCSGKGEFDAAGNLVYASAESPRYEGISDSIPVESIKVIRRFENRKDAMVWSKELGIYLLPKIEVKGLRDVLVFQICECDAVAAYSQDEARDWYKELTGLSDDELYNYEDVTVVPNDYKVRKGEENPELISIKEIVDTYWEGKPFIVFSTMD
jgi:hypothetical protein